MRILIGYLSLFLSFGCKETLPSIIDAPHTVSVDTARYEFDLDYKFYESNSKVQDRNFYFLSLLQKYKLALANESIELTQYLEGVSGNLENTIEADLNAPDYCKAFRVNEDSKLKLNSLLSKRFSSGSYDQLVIEMRKSGAFIQFSEVSDNTRYLQLALNEAIDGMNNIIEVYGMGEEPLYPDIDSGDFDVQSNQFRNIVRDLAREVYNQDLTNNNMVLTANLSFVLKLLDVNQRDEAGRYFPMKNGVNKQAFERIPDINWNEYEYSLILVLGDSPNSSGDLPNISQGGMRRADHGVKLLKDGMAPLIAFSGGHLFPVHTPYSEAIEMKKYVMEKYGLQENQILVDPHARHTTTNVRNVSRLIFRYGIPDEMKGIISTSESHSQYVASERFMTRSANEMNHIPCELFDRLSIYDIEFKPKIETLHLDSSDPLDP